MIQWRKVPWHWLAFPCFVILTSTEFGNARPFSPAIDLGAFLASGRASLLGLNPYAAYPLMPGWIWPNLDPPILMPLFETVGRFDTMAVEWVWFPINLALGAMLIAFLWCAYPETRSVIKVGWFLASVPLWATIAYGQIYLPLVIASVLAVREMEHKRLIRAGLLLGIVVAVKPNFAPVLVLLLVGGYAMTAIVAGSFAAFLGLLILVRYPPQIYVQWLNAGLGVHYLGVPSAIAGQIHAPALGYAFVAVSFTAAAWWVRRASLSPLDLTTLAFALCLFLLPWSGQGYLLWLTPAVLRHRWAPAYWLAVVTFLAPGQITTSLPFALWFFHPAILLIIIRHARPSGERLIFDQAVEHQPEQATDGYLERVPLGVRRRT